MRITRKNDAGVAIVVACTSAVVVQAVAGQESNMNSIEYLSKGADNLSTGHCVED